MAAELQDEAQGVKEVVDLLGLIDQGLKLQDLKYVCQCLRQADIHPASQSLASQHDREGGA